jgi:hypothetical protein
VRAYQRAGFEVVPLTDEERLREYGPGEYPDTVVLRKVFDS